MNKLTEAGLNYNSNYEYWPIPSNEISINPNLKQLRINSALLSWGWFIINSIISIDSNAKNMKYDKIDTIWEI